MSEKRELNLKELDFVSGGNRKRIHGNYYEIHFEDGSIGYKYNYEEAVEWANKHGGTIETKWGVIGRKGREAQNKPKIDKWQQYYQSN